MNASDNMGAWLVILAVSAVVGTWNISQLWIVRPAIDRLVALIGAVAIMALVIGASVVFTAIAQPASRLSIDRGASENALVAVTDLALCAALITIWLRSDACRPSGQRDVQ